MSNDAALHLSLPPELLRPLVREVVAEVVAALEQDRAGLGDKLAYSESEAARLLSLHSHQLRDERRRGRIKASTGPGRKVLYAKQDLLNYLAARRWKKSDP
jgi:Helix-turn-helix domain